MKKRVIVGMSGGVDSSVTAALLLQQGYEVIGVTLKVLSEKEEDQKNIEGGCCSLGAVDDARHVANKLNIPYYVLNFQTIFKEKVIDYFVQEYIHGRTPNPCIMCNKYIKFEYLLKKAVSLEADFVATGHYAKIDFDKNTKRYIIKKSLDSIKDQTYVLYNFTQHQLEHTLMPLGNYTKTQTREMAKNLGLIVASKPESQEICFIPDNNYAKFIETEMNYISKPGNFVDTKGNVIGKHKGIIYYTIGQRKGLGGFGKRMFVVDIDVKNNKVVLGEENEIYSNELIASNMNFIPFESLLKPMNVTAKIRYAAKESPALITPLDNGNVRVNFNDPQRAVTPGQAVVFYDGDVLVGGGIIQK